MITLGEKKKREIYASLYKPINRGPTELSVSSHLVLRAGPSETIEILPALQFMKLCSWEQAQDRIMEVNGVGSVEEENANDPLLPPPL